jgi:hypothetical protein
VDHDFDAAAADHDFAAHDVGDVDHDFDAGGVDHDVGAQDVAADHDFAAQDAAAPDQDLDLAHEAHPGMDVDTDSVAHEADAGDHAAPEHADDFHASYGEAVGGFRFGLLSPLILSTVLCCFGGVGLALLYSGLMSGSPWRYVSLVPALLSSGVFGLFFMWVFNTLFSKIEASSEVAVRSLIGREAQVITPIPAGGFGEIATTARGTRWTSAARSADGEPIAKYARVIITERRRHVCLVLPVTRKTAEDRQPAEPAADNEQRSAS